MSGWPEGVQADCLRVLAVAESRQAAVHARVLSAFSVPGGGLAGDGHGSARVWLTWQTQATGRAAAGKVGWMRRLAAHPLIAAALAGGQLSVSWAQQLIEWSARLPADARDDADGRFLAAAANGASLTTLAGLAEDLRREHAVPDEDGDGFTDRSVRLGQTFGGAGRLVGDLTARCAAAGEAVLDALGTVTGPEDTRTLEQRRHDALEEAFIRLIGSGMLPQRAGQPVRLELDITLQDLVNNTGGVACDAVVQPVITGHADYELLERLADPEAAARMAALQDACAAAARDARFGDVLAAAIALLSGPAGHAAALRRKLQGGPAVPVSLPLDIPGTFDTIPVHLRRAVRTRDRHCRFPGCDQPVAACDVHHIVHRKDGGTHALTNLILMCRFHHLVAIHRWGWTITLHPDGTTTAVSPDLSKTLHSHTPPARAA